MLESLPTRERELKQDRHGDPGRVHPVAPYTGA